MTVRIWIFWQGFPLYPLPTGSGSSWLFSAMSSMAFETKQEMDVVTAFFVPAGSFPSFSDFVRAGEAVSSSSAAAIQPGKAERLRVRGHVAVPSGHRLAMFASSRACRTN